MECLSLLNFFIFSLKYSLFWNIIKNVKPNKVYGLSSFSGGKEIVRKALQFSRIKNKTERTKETENIEEVNTSHIIFISD